MFPAQAEALYKVGERLFACVDADFREMPLRVRRPPVHLDVQRLEVFQNKLHEAANGVAACVEINQ